MCCAPGGGPVTLHGGEGALVLLPFTTQEMEAWGQRIRRHVENPNAYAAFYHLEHVPNPVAAHGDPRFWLPRAHDAVDLVRRHAPRGRVLEVGCYDVPVGFAVASSLPDVRYTGVDFNPSALARFQKLLDEQAIQASLRAEEGEPDGTFDVVIWTEVIEHVADPVSEMRRLLRWLRPGGWLFISTPPALPALAGPSGTAVVLPMMSSSVPSVSPWFLPFEAVLSGLIAARAIKLHGKAGPRTLFFQ